MKTYSPKPEHIERRWYVLDAGEQVLGRVASEAAVILRGKHKPIFAPHMDVGDNLIIINAAKVVLTGGKETKKVAWRHSGHPGGITGTLYEDLLAKRPAFAVEKAVRGMLPKNRLGRAMIKKLHVVPGPEHPHQAQKPVDWTMGMRPAWEGLPARRGPAVNGKKAARRVGRRTGDEHVTTTEQADEAAASEDHGEATVEDDARRSRRPPRSRPRRSHREEAERQPRSPREEDRREEAGREVDGEEEGDVGGDDPGEAHDRPAQGSDRPRATRPRQRRVPDQRTVARRVLPHAGPPDGRAVAAPLRSAGTRSSTSSPRSPAVGSTVRPARLRLGIARALLELDPELRAQLKAEGFLRRDAREKERRKYGLKKARKAPQYSKR